MAEYIDREALMKFPIRANHCDKEHANEHFINGIETVMEYAEHLPAADVVEVVRCKDCKYNSGTKKCLHPDSFFAVPKDDDFCSYGERKDGGAK